MFQISAMSGQKAAVSALTVLAAMGSSGMVAEAAVVEPSKGGYTRSSSYAYMDTNYQNWLTVQGSTYIGGGRGFLGYDTNVIFAADIQQAKMVINPINAGATYGIPADSVLYFALIVEPWSETTAKSVANSYSSNDPDGWNVGTAAGTEVVTALAPAADARLGGVFEADITPLLQHWQANPGSYYGIRVYSGAAMGGVYPPSDSNDGSGTMGNLNITAVVPEPTTLAILGTAGLLALRRRR